MEEGEARSNQSIAYPLLPYSAKRIPITKEFVEENYSWINGFAQHILSLFPDWGNQPPFIVNFELCQDD